MVDFVRREFAVPSYCIPMCYTKTVYNNIIGYPPVYPRSRIHHERAGHAGVSGVPGQHEALDNVFKIQMLYVVSLERLPKNAFVIQVRIECDLQSHSVAWIVELSTHAAWKQIGRNS